MRWGGLGERREGNAPWWGQREMGMGNEPGQSVRSFFWHAQIGQPGGTVQLELVARSCRSGNCPGGRFTRIYTLLHTSTQSCQHLPAFTHVYTRLRPLRPVYAQYAQLREFQNIYAHLRALAHMYTHLRRFTHITHITHIYTQASADVPPRREERYAKSGKPPARRPGKQTIPQTTRNKSGKPATNHDIPTRTDNELE